MYDALFKFKLVPVNHNESKTTFLTEMVNEQLIFHYSLTSVITIVEYKDFNENIYSLQTHIVFHWNSINR